MAKLGSAATSFLARSTFDGPNWKLSIFPCSSASSFLASGERVLHSKWRPGVTASSATALGPAATAASRQRPATLFMRSLHWIGAESPPPDRPLLVSHYGEGQWKFREFCFLRADTGGRDPRQQVAELGHVLGPDREAVEDVLREGELQRLVHARAEFSRAQDLHPDDALALLLHGPQHRDHGVRVRVHRFAD